MKATTQGDISVSPTSDGSTVSESVESFVEATTEALEDAGAGEEAVSAVEDTGEVLVDVVEETAQQAVQARERARGLEHEVEQLEDELDEVEEGAHVEWEGPNPADISIHPGEEGSAVYPYQALQDRGDAIEEIEDRVNDIEEGGSSDATPTPQTEQTPSVEPETALEDVIRIPEHLVEDSLTANQQRARFVAKDVHEYTRSVRAGRLIKSSELRRVLSAGEDGTIYTETVSRVIGYLDELGEDDVEVAENRSGERVVVFDDDLVKRIVAWSNQDDHSVVSGEVAPG